VHTWSAGPAGPVCGVISAPSTATDSTEGSVPPDNASRVGSPEVSTQRPSVPMPIGSTS
jgi:hypothetical protein